MPTKRAYTTTRFDQDDSAGADYVKGLGLDVTVSGKITVLERGDVVYIINQYTYNNIGCSPEKSHTRTLFYKGKQVAEMTGNRNNCWGKYETFGRGGSVYIDEGDEFCWSTDGRGYADSATEFDKAVRALLDSEHFDRVSTNENGVGLCVISPECQLRLEIAERRAKRQAEAEYKRVHALVTKTALTIGAQGWHSALVAEITGIDKKAARKHLDALVEAGELFKTSTGKNRFVFTRTKADA